MCIRVLSPRGHLVHMIVLDRKHLGQKSSPPEFIPRRADCFLVMRLLPTYTRKKSRHTRHLSTYIESVPSPWQRASTSFPPNERTTSNPTASQFTRPASPSTPQADTLQQPAAACSCPDPTAVPAVPATTTTPAAAALSRAVPFVTTSTTIAMAARRAPPASPTAATAAGSRRPCARRALAASRTA